MYTWLSLRSAQYAGAFLVLNLIVTGCSTLSGETKVLKTTKGSVHLKEIADWSFEASHPAAIDPMIIRQVVKSVVTEDATKPSPNMPASGSKPMRVFSDEDAEFLAPLLAQGLSEAKPEQIVGFKVFSSAGSGAEPTAGTLYVHKGSLYLTIAPSQANKGLRFVPTAAARIEKSPSFVAMGKGAMTMVFDYQAFAKASTPGSVVVADSSATMPASHSSSTPSAQVAEATPSREDEALLDPTSVQTKTESEVPQLSTDELLNRKLDELRAVREANKLKDSEIAKLKKEATLVKKELRQRTDEVKALKASKASALSAPKKKAAEAHRTR